MLVSALSIGTTGMMGNIPYMACIRESVPTENPGKVDGRRRRPPCAHRGGELVPDPAMRTVPPTARSPLAIMSARSAAVALGTGIPP